MTKEVLILIIMEDTLRGGINILLNITILRLNPYYNGRYSTSIKYTQNLIQLPKVLILIIVEDTL